MKGRMESTVSSTCFHNMKKDFVKTKHGRPEKKKEKLKRHCPREEVNVPEKASVRTLNCLE